MSEPAVAGKHRSWSRRQRRIRQSQMQQQDETASGSGTGNRTARRRRPSSKGVNANVQDANDNDNSLPTQVPVAVAAKTLPKAPPSETPPAGSNLTVTKPRSGTRSDQRNKRGSVQRLKDVSNQGAAGHAPVCGACKSGKCKRGGRCKDRHETQAKASRSEIAPICGGWVAGRCNKGDECSYRHENESLGTSIQEAMTYRQRAEDEQKARAEQLRLEQEERLRQERIQREEAERAKEHTRQVKIARLQEQTRQREEYRLAEVARRQEEARRREERERVEAERRLEEERQKQAREAEIVRLQEEARRREEEEERAEVERRLEEELQEIAQEAREAKEANWREEAGVTERYIVMDHSLITCGAGLDIQHIVPGFELGRIIIGDLPWFATREEISDMLVLGGISTSEFFIPPDGFKQMGRKFQANILVRTEKVPLVAAGLSDFPGATLTLERGSGASWNSMGVTDMTTPLLEVNWMAPTEALIAFYHSVEDAKQKVQSLNGLEWNSHRLKASLDNHRSGGPQTPRIKLLHCPVGSSSDDAFANLTGAYHHQVLHEARYTREQAKEIILDHLRCLDGVRMDTYHDHPVREATGMIKARVSFHDWDDVKRAFDSVHDQTLGRCLKTRAWYPAPHRYEIKIPIHQYQAQKQQWDTLAEKKSGRDAYLQVRIGDRGDAFVRVLGNDKKATGALKVRVEGMVAGERLDPTLWHASFLHDRTLFDRIHASTGVFIRIDPKTRSLRVYGDNDSTREVRAMIRAEVERLAGMETIRVLDHEALTYFLREGLGKLDELLGENNVVLNVACRPPQIVIKGGEEARHHLEQLIDESRSYVPLMSSRVGEDEDAVCPVCYNDASNPEELGCGHTYCAGCLRHLLSSAADAEAFPLVCMGDEATCNTPISIPLIRRFMHPQVFDKLVETAFNAYLMQHPQDLKYCKTPDCQQTYRPGTDLSAMQCPSCSATICPGCDEEAHEGMSCAERKLQSDPAYQQQREVEKLQANGCKKCPGCNIWIQKTEGCNHMRCKKCKIHFCWLCLGVFTRREVYRHIDAVHRGADAALGRDERGFGIVVEPERPREPIAERYGEGVQPVIHQQPGIPGIPILGRDGEEIEVSRRLAERGELDELMQRRVRETEQRAQAAELAECKRLLEERERELARERNARASAEGRLRQAKEREKEIRGGLSSGGRHAQAEAQRHAMQIREHNLKAWTSRREKEIPEGSEERGWCLVM
ncbi:hypothetical protein BXZ70DRAFT_1065437 [Cristinia sonorae]|uniref:Uncharacterized protein n=1 Tax=Cristinia sonorae TaxID=1940300 RepID=A0A8K0XPG5_9AGAR|nr:hypothetical protein BXZ70DRAFT_1065437 [Cristinia sonorae]